METFLAFFLTCDPSLPMVRPEDFRVFRLVDRQETLRRWQEAEGYVAWLKVNRWRYARPEEYSREFQHAEWVRRVWYAVDDVAFYKDDNVKKWRALSKLRELIGCEAYYRGILPRPMPREIYLN
jgi:hypothetical protein